MVSKAVTQGAGGIASTRGHAASDARMLRRLLKSPIYVPNEVFRYAAVKMWDIVQDVEADPRARVSAQKTLNEIMRINLDVRESIKEKQASEQHLHLHGTTEQSNEELLLELNEIVKSLRSEKSQ